MLYGFKKRDFKPIITNSNKKRYLSRCLAWFTFDNFKKKSFIKRAIIEWNRHGNNESTLKRRSYKLIIPDRLNLIVSLIMRIFFNK